MKYSYSRHEKESGMFIQQITYPNNPHSRAYTFPYPLIEGKITCERPRPSPFPSIFSDEHRLPVEAFAQIHKLRKLETALIGVDIERLDIVSDCIEAMLYDPKDLDKRWVNIERIIERIFCLTIRQD